MFFFGLLDPIVIPGYLSKEDESLVFLALSPYIRSYYTLYVYNDRAIHLTTFNFDEKNKTVKI